MSRALKHVIDIILVAFIFSDVTSRGVVAQDQDLAHYTTCINLCLRLYSQFDRLPPHSTLPPSVNEMCRNICLLIQTQTTSTTAPTTTTYTKSTSTRTTTTQPRVRTDIEPSCGLHQILRNRIVGGTEADECEFPWVVSLTFNNTFLCGGTIVDKRHVITAVHCLESEWGRLLQFHEVQVNVGSSSRQNQRAYDVVELIRNPKYNRTTNNYDIAVLVLAEELIYSKCVAPLCLPVPSTRVMDGEVCVTAGWGKLNHTDEDGVPYLRKVRLPIVNNDLCRQGYWKHKSSINDLTLCAGDYYQGLIGSCKGDSGGPLMCLDDGRWVLRGVTSFGDLPCAKPTKPTVFTRLAHPNITNFIDGSLARTNA